MLIGVNTHEKQIFPYLIKSENNYLLVCDHAVDLITNIRSYNTYIKYYLFIHFFLLHISHIYNILWFTVILLAVKKQISRFYVQIFLILIRF